jgi:hypothetical protein
MAFRPENRPAAAPQLDDYAEKATASAALVAEALSGTALNDFLSDELGA